MAVPPASVSRLGVQGAQTPGYDAWDSVEMNDFIKLLVAELSNQDPMNPMENSEIVQQVSQIREIASNDKLSATLDAVLMGQNMAAASSLIGKMVWGLSDDAEKIAGIVKGVEIVDGLPQLHVGDYVMPLKNVAGITYQGETGAGSETGEATEETEGTNEDGQTDQNGDTGNDEGS